MKLQAIMAVVFIMAALYAAASAAPAPQATAPKNPVVRIALVADPHVNNAPTGDEANYKARFLRVIAEVNAAHVSRVLIAGDLTQNGKPEQFAEFKELVRGFQAPVSVVCGNHDVGPKIGITDAKPGSGVTAERVAKYEALFGKSFYTLNCDGVRIIGINSPILGSGLPVEARQWEFLERELLPSASPGIPTLLVTHYPLYLVSPEEAGGTYWNTEPAPRTRLLGLIKKSGNVLAVLSGHLHRPLVSKTSAGVLLYSSPPVSFGLPAGKQPEGWTLVTIAPTTNVIQTEFHAISHLSGAEAPIKPSQDKS